MKTRMFLVLVIAMVLASGCGTLLTTPTPVETDLGPLKVDQAPALVPAGASACFTAFGGTGKYVWEMTLGVKDDFFVNGNTACYKTGTKGPYKILLTSGKKYSQILTGTIY